MTNPYNPAALDFLLGRSLDVNGVMFACEHTGRPDGARVRVGWPSILVELNLSVREVTDADRLTDGTAPAAWGADVLGPALSARGLTRATSFDQPPEPDGPVRWTMRLRDGARRRSGVYGPGVGGTPGAWALMSPLPAHRPELWLALLAHTGGRCGVYLTTDTHGLVATGDPQAFTAGLRTEAEAGRLWGARAVVVR